MVATPGTELAVFGALMAIVGAGPRPLVVEQRLRGLQRHRGSYARPHQHGQDQQLEEPGGRAQAAKAHFCTVRARVVL